MISAFDENVSDGQLFRAVADNDRHAFEILFRRYYAQVCVYVQFLLGSSSEAEDVVQDIFAYIWKNRSVIVLEKQFRCYLFSTAKHASLNLLKHRAIELKHHPMLIEYIEDLSRNDYAEEEEEMIRNVRSAIERLPDQCRMIFRMSCLDRMTYREIADRLGVSVNTVKTHIRRAYSMVRSTLGNSPENYPILFLYLLNCSGGDCR